MAVEQVEIVETSTGAALVPTETPEPPVSIADHASQFSPEAQAQAAEAEVKPAELKPVRPVDQQKRTEAGQFTEGQKRLKSKDAVDRINQLTGRAKSAEEKLAAAEAELGRLRTRQAPAAQIVTAERKVEQAEQRIAPVGDDPEPAEDDPKYGGDYAKYLRDVTRWETRQALAADRAESAKQADQVKRDEAKGATIRTFAERLTAAKEKYQDFEDTLQWDAPWLAKSGEPHRGYEATHDFIMLDEQGADVLQYLRTHPDEVDALMQVPPIQQVKRLTLLGQRFASQTPTGAGTTRSAPARTVVHLPPKPPNLVRTEVQSQGNHPPPTDGSLSIADHGKAFGPKRK